jgi:hypothetical protein
MEYGRTARATTVTACPRSSGASGCSSPISATLASRTPEQTFVFHFVLGRCLAEKYETERAIAQFKEAIALSPDDVDSYMALLAELSILTHRSLPTSVSADDKAWENEFVDKLALVRRRFASENDVNRMMVLVFNPSEEVKLAEQSPAALPKLRRIGYGVFRWKRR